MNKKHLHVVGACIIQNHKIFAVRRSYGSGAVIHKLEFVGGKCEEGEDERSALVRECKEELALDICVGEHFRTFTYEYADKIVTLSVWFCKMLSDFTLKEHEEYKWLDVRQLHTDRDEYASSDWAPADAPFLTALNYVEMDLCYDDEGWAMAEKRSYTMITGATGVLGKCFAKTCYQNMEHLFLTGRNHEKLQALKEELEASIPDGIPRPDIITYACDLCDENSRKSMYQSADGLQLSRLINVAGADIQKAFDLYDEDKLVFQTRACLEGTVSTCSFAISHAAEGLKIINISSVSGIYPMPYFALYSATKGAVTQFSLALHEECKPKNIGVTCVLPGAIYTRPDVVENIKTQGVWGKWAAKTPQFVVDCSLAAAQKNKAKVIPGFCNRLMNTFTKLLPLSWKMKYIANRWSKTQKDAF